MTGKRFETLDGWRGIAAVAIVLYHMPIVHPLRGFASWKNMEMFVDLFFVLSGFVIMHAWGKRLSSPAQAGDFMLRRFWRVWPLHMFILMAFVGIEIAKLVLAQLLSLNLDDSPFERSRSFEAGLSNILLIQSFNLHGSTTWNGPAWSISVEFWTYAVFAAVMVLARGRTSVLIAIAGVGLAGAAFLSPIYQFATHDFGMFRALYGFFVGALVYRLVAQDNRDEIMRKDTALELAAILAMGVWFVSTGIGPTSLLAPVVFAGLVVAFARGDGVFSSILKSRLVQALGLWSYSIYLIHTLIFYSLRLTLMALERVGGIKIISSGTGSERIFSSGFQSVDALIMLVLLALTILISRFTYNLIEVPFMAQGNKGVPEPEFTRLSDAR